MLFYAICFFLIVWNESSDVVKLVVKTFIFNSRKKLFISETVDVILIIWISCYTKNKKHIFYECTKPKRWNLKISCITLVCLDSKKVQFLLTPTFNRNFPYSFRKHIIIWRSCSNQFINIIASHCNTNRLLQSAPTTKNYVIEFDY